ncbi:hypothetical protein GKC34_08860 [Lactobacillus salivarius]|uniref:Uncharacterized protein n=1 Tax=Ligilactobacillus salivarius TaxID=1624 RepID=A0A6A8LP70_9LACO|nr:hypothetical protein [Ligilactobacillus salivarius]
MEKTKQLLATAGVVLTLTPQVLSTTQAVKAAKIVGDSSKNISNETKETLISSIVKKNNQNLTNLANSLKEKGVEVETAGNKEFVAIPDTYDSVLGQYNQ